MTASSEKAGKLIAYLNSIEPMDELIQKVVPQLEGHEMIRETNSVPSPLSWSAEARQKRLKHIEKANDHALPYLLGEKSFAEPESLRGNIENYIGMTQVPTGIIGPLMVKGIHANGEFFVPMATTEGALVASYNRGAKACKLSGGISSICTTEGVQRTPAFKFRNMGEVGKFVEWVIGEIPKLKEIVAHSSRFAILEDIRINIEGNMTLIVFEYTTGDAAGQNMVTICTDIICRYIIEQFPIKPQHWFLESNYSGDKKATAVSFSNVRGKKITAEVTMPKKIVQEVLHTTPELMDAYWKVSCIAGIQSGSIGTQGHYANGLTAIFMACGQDVACVAEASVGITRIEINENGDLYACVTLPNMIVGTVGGGTHLSTQNECLEIMGCAGAGKSKKFAEICGAAILAGELSIAAAIASGDFAKAHLLFGRKPANAAHSTENMPNG